MIELRQALEKMKTDMRFFLRSDTKFTPLLHMEKLSKQLETDIGARDISTMSLTDIKQIIVNIRQGQVLTNKEKNELPFVMAAECCEIGDFENCLKLMNFSKKRILRRLIFAFFLNYSNFKAWQKYGFCKLIQKRLSLLEYNQNTGFMSMMKKFVNVIFVENCPRNIARVIDRNNGIIKCAEVLKLPEQLKFSSLIIEAIKSYYMELKAPLTNKMDILGETLSNQEAFTGIMPCIADGLIKSVQNERHNEYKKRCIDVFYKILGDPRFGHRKVRWNEVSDESRRIFLSWLAEKDLELFFRIIEATSVDSMWRYRKNFWIKYLPNIVNTWVLFGKDAMEMVREIDDYQIAYGKLGKGCLPNHSVFAFQIGDYVFIEWSHNGMLRVWNVDEAPDIFGAKTMNKDMITKSLNAPLGEWIHSASSNQNWQNKVKFWLRNYCGI